jgi:WD40 repeat protein
LCALTARAQEKLPLQLAATTPLPGFTGDLDHFGRDLRGNRLFLASEDQKTIEVFDLHTGKRINSITGFGQALTMAYLAESNHLIVTDGGDTDAVELVDCKTYTIINTLKLGPGVRPRCIQSRKQKFLCRERRRAKRQSSCAQHY